MSPSKARRHTATADKNTKNWIITKSKVLGKMRKTFYTDVSMHPNK
jgi:hypothetical protein